MGSEVENKQRSRVITSKAVLYWYWFKCCAPLTQPRRANHTDVCDVVCLYSLTCPCALVTSCPVAPWRLDKALPNTWEPAMEPMAAAAATAAWLARGFN